MTNHSHFAQWIKDNDLNTYRLSKLWGISPQLVQANLSRGDPTWSLVEKLSDRIVTLQNDVWLKEQALHCKIKKEEEKSH